MILESIATLCAGAFSGAAAYVTFVEHPARLERGPEFAIRQFGPSYRRAAIMQASLAVVGSAAGGIAWLRGGSGAWLAGALLLLSVVPFTLLVVAPTNRRLLDPDLDAGSPEAVSLLRRWGGLHAVRTLLGVAAFVAFVWGA